jgi:hypothetical protein
MDPIKEKLNLLRRLASEKKTPVTSASAQNQQKAAATANSCNRESSVNSSVDLDSNNNNNDPNGLLTSSSLPRPSSLAYSKYINRIRSMYDKERSSSTESVQQSKQPLALNRQSSPLIQSFTDQSRETPLFDETSKANFEISEYDIDDDFDDSIQSMASNLQQANSINRYLRHVKNKNSFLKISPGQRAASVENLQRNNNLFGSNINVSQQLAQPHLELNQINRLKEKFSKPDARHNSLESSNIHTNFSINNFLSLQNDMKRNDQYKSMRTLSKPDDYIYNGLGSQVRGSTPIVKMQSAAPVKFDIVEKTPPDLSSATTQTSNSTNQTSTHRQRGGKQLQKYQRSRTSDLSDLIFGEDREKLENEENEGRGRIEERSVEAINNNYNMLVDKYATDLKYTPETAIIRSTMNQSRQFSSPRATDTLIQQPSQHQMLNNGEYFILD